MPPLGGASLACRAMEYLIRYPPHLLPIGDACITVRPDHAFFEEAKLKGLLGDNFLQVARFTTKPLHLIGVGLTHRVTSKALLPCLNKLLRPRVILALRYTLLPNGICYAIAYRVTDDTCLLYTSDAADE